MAAAVLAPLVTSCGSGPASDDELLVSAASSLTDAFGELAEGFEAQHPGLQVVLNLDSSSTLAAQVLSGAPVDVFASADAPNMAEVAEAGLLEGTAVEMATNSVVLVAGADERNVPSSLTDLVAAVDRGGVVALCASSAPCGRLADEALAAQGVELPEGRVTRAPNARATLGAVTRGDAVAALVYRSDAHAAGDAVTVAELPPDAERSTAYVVAALRAGQGDGELAAAFVAYVTSPEGAEVLAAEGFR